MGWHPNTDRHLDGHPHAQRHGYQGASADPYSHAHGDADPKTNRYAIAGPVNGHCAPIAYPNADHHTLYNGEGHANTESDVGAIPVTRGHRPRDADVNANGNRSPAGLMQD